MISLQVKTEYSLLTSLIKVEDYVRYAKEHQLSSLVLTDTSLFGLIKFYDLCISNHIKPILGLTITLEGHELVLYAMNEVGYHHLLKLSTLVSEKALSVDDLDHYHEGLLCVLPFSSLDLLSVVNKIYPDLYLGYAAMEQRKELDSLYPKVFFREVLCLEKEETPYIRYLHAIRDGKLLTEVQEHGIPCHMMTETEYHNIPLEDRKNMEEIVSRCQVTIQKEKDLLPIYECPGQLSSYAYLKKLCVDGLRRIFGSRVSKVYQECLKYELDVINKMGFCNYFLVVWDYVRYAKEQGILVGPGRGSAGGSLVAYCLNITTIDPVKYDLLFERFLNPERVTMPDIDIDFEDERREEVISYCIKKYGLKKVAGIIAFGTLASRQALRDVGRVMNIPLKEIDMVCKMTDNKLSLEENIKRSRPLREHLSMDDTFARLYKVARRLEGLKRHTTIHAAGIVMCRKPLDEVIPLYQSREDFYLTGYSMKYLEPLGLLKMDFLALKNLTLIHHVLDLIEEHEHIKILFDDIPLENKEATRIFTTTNTVGIFQFESRGMMNFLRKLKANSFDDVSAAIALFRPGPMGNIDTYIRRKQGLEPVVYPDPSLEPILKSTYGIMIYQEQIMQVAQTMADFTYAQADVLRRAMSKKNHAVMEQERERFMRQSIAKGYSKEVSEKVYNLIDKFASYGFNKAHSVGYSVVAYRMAYLKAHYPTYFCAGLLSSVLGSEIKTKEYLYECKVNHITVLPPDIHRSTDKYEIEGHAIRYPLSGIKNVGLRAIETILEEREKRPFKDLYDFTARCYGKNINRKTMIALIYAGALDDFGMNKKTMVENLDLILNYADLIRELDESLVEKPMIEEYEEYNKRELMAQEKEVFGFYLSSHPVTEARRQSHLPLTILELPQYFDKNVELIVLVDHVKKIETKTGKEMCFVTGSDELNTLDMVLFPLVYQKTPLIEVGMLVRVQGHVEKRFDKYQLVVQQIQKVSE